MIDKVEFEQVVRVLGATADNLHKLLKCDLSALDIELNPGSISKSALTIIKSAFYPESKSSLLGVLDSLISTLYVFTDELYMLHKNGAQKESEGLSQAIEGLKTSISLLFKPSSNHTQNTDEIGHASIKIAEAMHKCACELALLLGAKQENINEANLQLAKALEIVSEFNANDDLLANENDYQNLINMSADEFVNAYKQPQRDKNYLNEDDVHSIMGLKQFALEHANSTTKEQIALNWIFLQEHINTLFADALMARPKDFVATFLTVLSTNFSAAAQEVLAKAVLAKDDELDFAKDALKDLLGKLIGYASDLSENYLYEEEFFVFDECAKDLSKALCENIYKLGSVDKLASTSEVAKYAAELSAAVNEAIIYATKSQNLLGKNSLEKVESFNQILNNFTKSLSEMAGVNDTPKSQLITNACDELIKASLKYSGADEGSINQIASATNLKNIEQKLGALISTTSHQKTKLMADSIELFNANSLNTQDASGGINGFFEGVSSKASSLYDKTLKTMGLTKEGAAASFSIGASTGSAVNHIAQMATLDASSTEGQKQLAKHSVALASELTSIAFRVGDFVQKTKYADAIMPGASAGFSSLAGLISSSIAMKDFGSLSKQEQIALGTDLGLKIASSISSGVAVGSSIAMALGKLSSVVPAASIATSGVLLAAKPMLYKQIHDEKVQAEQTDKLGKVMQEYGYLGDNLLAKFQKEKFNADVGVAAVDTAAELVGIAGSVASLFPAVGLPITATCAAISAIVPFITSGISKAALNKLASDMRKQILAESDAKSYFEKNTKAQISMYYDSEVAQKKLKDLQDAFAVKQVISLDGAQLSQSARELAGITELSEQANKANNYASLLKDGKVTPSNEKHMTFDQTAGVLTINSLSDALIHFNSPLFAPGQEKSERTKKSKQEHYTKLVINGPNRYLIDDKSGNNTYKSEGNYARRLYDSNGQIVKEITLEIETSKGNNTLIADSGDTNFSGGSGTDAAVYSDPTIHGIKVMNIGSKFYKVAKNIVGATVHTEHIRVEEIKKSKDNVEKVEYRDITADKKDFTSLDMLSNVDIIHGSNYNDEMYGGASTDIFFGGAGDDAIFGNGGDDILNGGAGNDYIDGGAGNDKIIQDDLYGNDEIDGGSGNDTLDYSGMKAGVKVDLKAGFAKKGDKGGTDVIKNIDNVVGTNYNDVIIGDDGDNILIAGAGSDELYGGAGNDVLIGGSGQNYLEGGAGDDEYIVQFSAQNTIKDSQGENVLNLSSQGQKVQLNVSYDKAQNALKLDTCAGAQKGWTQIFEFDKFGLIKLDDIYYLGVNPLLITKVDNAPIDFNFKAILNAQGSSVAKFNFNDYALGFCNKNSALEIYSLAKQSELHLSSVHSNIIKVQANTSTTLYDFNPKTDIVAFEDSSKLISEKVGNDLLISDASSQVRLIGLGDLDDIYVL